MVLRQDAGRGMDPQRLIADGGSQEGFPGEDQCLWKGEVVSHL